MNVENFLLGGLCAAMAALCIHETKKRDAPPQPQPDYEGIGGEEESAKFIGDRIDIALFSTNDLERRTTSRHHTWSKRRYY